MLLVVGEQDLVGHLESAVEVLLDVLFLFGAANSSLDSVELPKLDSCQDPVGEVVDQVLKQRDSCLHLAEVNVVLVLLRLVLELVIDDLFYTHRPAGYRQRVSTRESGV